MVRRLTGGCTVLALAGCALLALAGCGTARSTAGGADGPARAAVARCGPAGARTLAAGPRARVYALGRLVYGCVPGPRSPVRLGALGACLQSSSLGPVAVAGRTVAFGMRTCGVDLGTSSVVVVRLPSGRRVRFGDAVAGPLSPELFERVDAVAVTSSGDAAWVADWSSVATHRSATQVLSLTRRGVRLLDSGRGIAAGSLRVRAGRVSWRHGAVRRSAAL